MAENRKLQRKNNWKEILAEKLGSAVAEHILSSYDLKIKGNLDFEGSDIVAPHKAGDPVQTDHKLKGDFDLTISFDRKK